MQWKVRAIKQVEKKTLKIDIGYFKAHPVFNTVDLRWQFRLLGYVPEYYNFNCTVTYLRFSRLNNVTLVKVHVK